VRASLTSSAFTSPTLPNLTLFIMTPIMPHTYASFGHDHSTDNKATLVEHLCWLRAEGDLDIHFDTQMKKPELLVVIEKHYALAREAGGINKKDYLKPGWLQKATCAQMRQILSQYDIEYPANARKDELKATFAQSINQLILLNKQVSSVCRERLLSNTNTDKRTYQTQKHETVAQVGIQQAPVTPKKQTSRPSIKHKKTSTVKSSKNRPRSPYPSSPSETSDSADDSEASDDANDMPTPQTSPPTTHRSRKVKPVTQTPTRKAKPVTQTPTRSEKSSIAAKLSAFYSEQEEDDRVADLERRLQTISLGLKEALKKMDSQRREEAIEQIERFTDQCIRG
jgi:hypothetical protein